MSCLRLLIYASVAVSLLAANGGAQYAEKKADFGSFSAGHTKGQMHVYKMDSPWPITQALAIAWSFRFKGSVCVLVRDGRVFLLGDDTRDARIHDLPVKQGDSFHRYSEEDVKAWNLPVYQQADTIRILKEEAEKDKAKVGGGQSPPALGDTQAEPSLPAPLHPKPPDKIDPAPHGKSGPSAPDTSAASDGRMTFWLVSGLVFVILSALLWRKLGGRGNG